MHWQNRLFLTFESLTLHLIFLDSVKQCYLQTKTHAVTSSGGAQSITWYKQKGVEIGERQNRCQHLLQAHSPRSSLSDSACDAISLRPPDTSFPRMLYSTSFTASVAVLFLLRLPSTISLNSSTVVMLDTIRFDLTAIRMPTWSVCKLDDVATFVTSSLVTFSEHEHYAPDG